MYLNQDSILQSMYLWNMLDKNNYGLDERNTRGYGADQGRGEIHAAAGWWRNDSMIKAMAGLCLALAAALMTVGCAGVPERTGYGADATPEEIVKRRAQARWGALLAGDLDGAYGYASPAYRQMATAKQFKARFGAAVRWVDAVVDRVSCEEMEACEAVVMLTYRPVDPPGMETTRPLRETWILVNGEWWIHLR